MVSIISFVVVREIEQERHDFRVFTNEDEARSYYDLAYWICWNEPDDGFYGDPSIVTNCWLYSVQAASLQEANRMAFSERPVCLAACFP